MEIWGNRDASSGESFLDKMGITEIFCLSNTHFYNEEYSAIIKGFFRLRRNLSGVKEELWRR
jgi:hypothetical protein